MKKKDFLHQPVCVAGKIVFEFFNNNDEHFKTRALNQLTKEARTRFHISCLPVEESILENPERGTLVYAFVAITPQLGSELKEKVLAFFDEKSPGRILLEESDLAEL